MFVVILVIPMYSSFPSFLFFNLSASFSFSSSAAALSAQVHPPLAPAFNWPGRARLPMQLAAWEPSWGFLGPQTAQAPTMSCQKLFV